MAKYERCETKEAEAVESESKPRESRSSKSLQRRGGEVGKQAASGEGGDRRRGRIDGAGLSAGICNSQVARVWVGCVVTKQTGVRIQVSKLWLVDALSRTAIGRVLLIGEWPLLCFAGRLVQFDSRVRMRSAERRDETRREEDLGCWC